MLAVPTLTLTHIYTWHGMLQVWSQLSHSRIYLYIHIYMYTYVHLAWHGTGVVPPLTLTHIHIYIFTCIHIHTGMAWCKCGPNSHTYTYTYIHLAWHGTGVVSPLTLTYIHVYTCIYTWLGMVQVWSHLCSHAAGHLGLAAPLGNDVS
jgi:hypothetical protein